MNDLVGVVAGAVLGWGAGWLQQRIDRRRRRRGLATTMLMELRAVERNLREIAVSDRAAFARAPLSLTSFRKALAELDLFAPETIAELHAFMSRVGDLELGIKLLSDGHVQPSDHRSWEQQCRATFAANRVDAVKAVLFREGAILTPTHSLERERVAFPSRPSLEPPAFPQPRID